MDAVADSFREPPSPPGAGEAPAPCAEVDAGAGRDARSDAAVDPALTAAASRLPPGAPDGRSACRHAGGSAAAGAASLVVHGLLLGAAWALAGGMPASAPQRVVTGDATDVGLAPAEAAPAPSVALPTGRSAAGEITPPRGRELADVGSDGDEATDAPPATWASPLGTFAEAEAPSEAPQLTGLIGTGPTPLALPRRARVAGTIRPPAREPAEHANVLPASSAPTIPQQPGDGSRDAVATPAADAAAPAPAEPPSAEAGGTFVPPRPADGSRGRSRSGTRDRRDRLDGRGLPVPAYPSASKRMGESGLVLLEVEVLPDGTVGTVTVRSAPAYPRLVAAAVEAVRGARFDPATLDGRPVPATLTIPYRFVLL